MAQLVEHMLGKHEVPGPNPGSSSNTKKAPRLGCFFRVGAAALASHRGGAAARFDKGGVAARTRRPQAGRYPGKRPQAALAGR